MKLENKKNKKEKISLFLIGVVFTILILNLVSAHGNFNETKELIDSNISCKDLSEEQLEEMGDYYMEQMHPGESHEMMHDMMGGHDSETTKLMHINMAKGIYCDENVGMTGMMDMMMGGGMGSGMMSGGMMGNMMTGNVMGDRIMYGNYGWNIYSLLYLILLIGLIILVILIIIKLLKDLTKNKK